MKLDSASGNRVFEYVALTPFILDQASEEMLNQLINGQSKIVRVTEVTNAISVTCLTNNGNVKVKFNKQEPQNLVAEQKVRIKPGNQLIICDIPFNVELVK